MEQLDWNLVRAFTATVDAGSLSAAARKLGLTQPTLSRQVGALEASLGVALFERVGKRLTLTEAGLGLLAHARAMAAAADDLALAAAGRAEDVSGRVSISATDTAAAYLLPEIVESIRSKAPQIALVIVASNSLSDLRRREADIAIRHVRPTEPELVGRLVGEMTAHFYAAQSWLARNPMPRTVADLGTVDLVGFDSAERFAGHLSATGIPVTPEQVPIVSENGVVVWEMVRRGLGVGVMLSAIADRTEGIVRLLPDLPGMAVPVWLVSHRELRTSARVRLVFEALAGGLGRGMKPEPQPRPGGEAPGQEAR
jgi:DNA-binding transcriptional LysR family regulator